MARISDEFAAVLRARREECNARFAQARHQFPTLSAEAFADFLATGVDAVVRAVQAVAAERTEAVATEAYQIGLELVARNLVGASARQPAVAEAWRSLLPGVAALIAAAPRRVMGGVCNALCQLAAQPGARPGWWLGEMERIAPGAAAGDVEVFLRMGQVVAWRAGMAHFRAGALAVLDGWPEPLARVSLGLTDGGASGSWAEIRGRLETDPWYLPGTEAGRGGEGAVRLAARAGGFRGFGGLFTEPPEVAGGGAGQFFVRSGDGCWLLAADAFGATFHRAAPEEFARAAGRAASATEGVRVAGGSVEVRRERVALPYCGEITSHAVNRSTLAVTGSLSHAVLLVALPGAGGGGFP